MSYDSDEECRNIERYSRRILWSPQTEAEATPKAEDYIYRYGYNNPIPVVDNYRRIIDRTYEGPYRWYYLVFSPLDKPYKDDPEWFDTKGIDACRKKVTSSESYFVVKEKENCNKVHINILVLSDKDLSTLNGKIVLHKYRIYAEPCYSRRKTFEYITKEFRSREMILFQDYLYKLPSNAPFLSFH